MITEKIKRLFQFVSFLHSNIENFKKYDNVVNELRLLDEERNKLSPRKNFAHKLKYDKVQKEIEEKFKILEENIIFPTRTKASELNICDLNNPETIYNWNISEVSNLKAIFKESDISKIMKHKSKYLEYRTVTNCTYFQDIFYDYLDELLKELFDFFKETNDNEFQVFEEKAIKANDISEVANLIQKGYKKIELPLDFLQNPNGVKQQIDSRFWLTTFFEEQEQALQPYKAFQRQIENKGSFIINSENDTVKIYTPELAVIFTSKELSARNMDTQTETTVNGWAYLKTYIEAYKEGEQYFETEFKVSPNTLYGVNAEQYVRDIHLNFFHQKHNGTNEGWVYVKYQYPIILTHKSIKEFGYYSGIVNKVEQQMKKYPKLFSTFEKCEHDLPPQITESKIEAPIIKLFCAIVHQCKLLDKDIEESPEKFIKRVIEKYEIKNANPARARQYFDAEIDITKKDQKKYLRKVLELILPKIEPVAKQQIETYLQSKNLYA